MDFSKLDIFPKLDNKYRVGTKAGGLLSILSIVAIFVLSFSELRTFRNPPIRQRLFVDTSRPVGSDGVTISKDSLPQLDISINITFPQVPCFLMHFDAIDPFTQVSMPMGDAVKKIIRIKGSKILSEYDLPSLISRNFSTKKDYCGPCYVENTTGKCCNTCKSVIDLVEEKHVENITMNDIEQCSPFIDEFTKMEGEGCRFEIDFHVPKTDSEFHICPGLPTLDSWGRHAHNIKVFEKSLEELNLSHIITKLHFSKSANTSILDGFSSIQEKEGSYGVIYQADVLQDTFSVSKFAKYQPRSFPSGLTVVYSISPINAVKYVDKEPFFRLISRFMTVIGGVLCIFKILDYLLFATISKKSDELDDIK